MDKNKKLLKKEKLKKEKDKEKLKKEKDKEKLKKQKDKEKLKKEKQKEKLKKEKQKDKEKLKKQKEKEKLKKEKDKEKLKKEKDKEKLKKQKRKIRKNKYKGGVAGSKPITRSNKDLIIKILQSWEREDDADDYFEMWTKTLKISPENITKDVIDKKINTELFRTLNYNMLTELQKIKDLFFHPDRIMLSLGFKEIKSEIIDYSFLNLLTDTIDNFGGTDEKKKILLFGILKNLITIFVSLTKNIFEQIIFPPIGRSTFLYRSWRNESQLKLMKSQSEFYNEINTELITDNYLSSSVNKDSALNFYRKSSAGIKNFILWEVEVPETYPYLFVSHELEEVLIHIGAKLQYKGSEDDSFCYLGEEYNYTLEKYKWDGYCEHKALEVINKYNIILHYIEEFIKSVNNQNRLKLNLSDFPLNCF